LMEKEEVNLMAFHLTFFPQRKKSISA